MNESRLMQQVTAIFSVFMVLFYVGIGIFFIWYADNTAIDKAVRVILGVTFLFYGIYRAFRAWEKIRQAYFSKDDDDPDKFHRNGRLSRFK
jgi:Na+/phosphate symporter